MKIVFMGTPEFALPSLKAIVKEKHQIVGVVTQPDRPKGRGKHLSPPPIKEWAIKQGFTIYQPEKARNTDFIEQLKILSPDLIVTAAYGQILPKEILDIPPLGCINVHASLLPKYRGASPIHQALIDGQSETGITIMYMDVGMDTGDIILQRKLSILPHDNCGSLHDRLAELGAIALGEALNLFQKGKPEGIPQQHEDATYCQKVDKDMGAIDWGMSVEKIQNLVRGLTPWPGAYTYIEGRRIKVWDIEEWKHCKKDEYTPGQVVIADPREGLVVAVGNGFVRLVNVQGPGGRPMDDMAYLRGNPLVAGTMLKDGKK